MLFAVSIPPKNKTPYFHYFLPSWLYLRRKVNSYFDKKKSIRSFEPGRCFPTVGNKNIIAEGQETGTAVANHWIATAVPVHLFSTTIS